MAETINTETSTDTDKLDLYSLYHSDHLSIILVSELLKGDNYGIWSRAVRIGLSAKNEIEFVMGLSNRLLRQMQVSCYGTMIWSCHGY